VVQELVILGRNLKQPSLNKMFETFIRIGLPDAITPERVFNMIRVEVYRAICQVYPTINQPEKEGIANWFSFLIHDRETGSIPVPPDDKNFYFHIRVSLSGNNQLEDLKKSLPEYCLMTRQKKPEDVNHINIDDRGTRFDTSLLKQEKIEEVWRIIGEQSEFFLKVFNSYKENTTIPIREIWAFLHYFHNMVGLGVKCPKCGIFLL
jgi:hypothetical protein